MMMTMTVVAAAIAGHDTSDSSTPNRRGRPSSCIHRVSARRVPPNTTVPDRRRKGVLSENGNTCLPVGVWDVLRRKRYSCCHAALPILGYQTKKEARFGVFTLLRTSFVSSSLWLCGCLYRTNTCSFGVMDASEITMI